MALICASVRRSGFLASKATATVEPLPVASLMPALSTTPLGLRPWPSCHPALAPFLPSPRLKRGNGEEDLAVVGVGEAEGAGEELRPPAAGLSRDGGALPEEEGGRAPLPRHLLPNDGLEELDGHLHVSSSRSSARSLGDSPWAQIVRLLLAQVIMAGDSHL